jgi:hypothetical protein
LEKVSTLEAALEQSKQGLVECTHHWKEALEACKGSHKTETEAQQSRHAEELGALRCELGQKKSQVERLQVETSGAKHRVHVVCSELENARSAYAQQSEDWGEQNTSLQQALKRERDHRALSSIELTSAQDELRKAHADLEESLAQVKETSTSYFQRETELKGALALSKEEARVLQHVLTAERRSKIAWTIRRMGRGMLGRAWRKFADVQRSLAEGAMDVACGTQMLRKSLLQARRLSLARAWRAWMESQYRSILDEEVAKHTTICDDYSVLETNHEQEVNELQKQVDGATRENEQLACKMEQLASKMDQMVMSAASLNTEKESLEKVRFHSSVGGR